MRKTRVAFVLTGHDRLGVASDDNAAPTGFHLGETAVPWCILTDANVTCILATPDGRDARVDASSRDDTTPMNRRFIVANGIADRLQIRYAVASLHWQDLDAVYFPGGHGTMWDLPTHSGVKRLVEAMLCNGRTVGAICHGPAALLSARDGNGGSVLEDRFITAFTDSEEESTGKSALMPFSLEQALRRRGALFVGADDFKDCVVEDANLITGQNPASAARLAYVLLNHLREQRASR